MEDGESILGEMVLLGIIIVRLYCVCERRDMAECVNRDADKSLLSVVRVLQPTTDYILHTY